MMINIQQYKKQQIHFQVIFGFPHYFYHLFYKSIGDSKEDGLLLTRHQLHVQDHKAGTRKSDENLLHASSFSAE